jgi:Protein of unknown function (DUF1559)
VSQTVVLVTADHGGMGKGHGGATMAELEIPWILHGPGVATGKELTTFVSTYDTAATIAYIFGLKTPECWIARPVGAYGNPWPHVTIAAILDGTSNTVMVGEMAARPVGYNHNRQNQRFRVASALLLTMLSLAGCGNQPAGYSRVFGKLSYKGEPAAGASLVFHLEGKPQSADLVVPSATVEDDGSTPVFSSSLDPYILLQLCSDDLDRELE